VVEQLAEGGLCDAGAFAHPAFLKESHFFNLQSEGSPCTILEVLQLTSPA